MQPAETLSYKIGSILERRSGRFLFAILAISTMLVIPLLTMAPEEEASGDPGGQVFDLQEDIDQRFPSAVHSAGFIVEAKDGDVLTQKTLWELYQNTQKLRQADQDGKLTPLGLESQPYLFTFYFAGIDRSVVGIYTLADAVQAVLTMDPMLNITLEQASDEQVKLALHQLLSDPQMKQFREDMSVMATMQRRQVAGQEIDYWRSPAFFTFMVADNEKLGGGSLRIGVTRDNSTTNKELLNRKVQEILRGNQESYRLWGIAIDVGLESDDESILAGPFIMFTVIGVLIVVGVALRSYWAVAVTGAGLGILMIWLKGISNLIGLKSGLIIDLIVPIAMISLGIDFAIYALHRYDEEKAKGHAPHMALRVGFASALGALALAMMTDGVAFLSNITSGIESIIGFGIAAAIAVMASFIILGIAAPVAMMRIDVRRTNITEHHKLTQHVTPTFRRCAILGQVLAILAAAGLTGTAIILLLATSAIIGVALIAAFIVFGILLPFVIMMRLDRGKRVSVASEAATLSGSGCADHLIDNAGSAKESVNQKILGVVVVRLAQSRAILLPIVAMVTAAAVFFALQLEASFDVKDFFDSSSDLVVSLDKLDEHVGKRRGEPAIIYIKGDLTNPEALRAIKQLVDNLKHNPYLAKDAEGELSLPRAVLTLLESVTNNEYARSEVEKMTGIEIVDADDDSIPDTAVQIKAVYDYMVEFGVPLNGNTLVYDAANVRQTLFHEPNGTKEDVTILETGIPGTRELSVVRVVRKAMEEDIKILNEAPSISFSGLTGSPFTREAQLRSTSKALIIALPIAMVLCFLVSLLGMRSLRFAVVTIIPVGLVVAWLYAFMYLAGFALNFVTAIIAAVSIGVGINYSIHFTQRFREEMDKALDSLEALKHAAQGTGIALLGSATSSIVGFTIMGFAPMPVFSAYGILTAIMIFSAATAALLVLPSLLLLVAPAQKKTME